MHPITFRCPGCGTALVSATAFQPGKLVDCPKCKLLFTPFEEDIKIPRGRGDELAMERQWSDGEIRGPYPSPSPWGWKRRYQNLGPIVQAVLIVGAGVLLVGGVALGMYLSMGRPPAPVVAHTVPRRLRSTRPRCRRLPWRRHRRRPRRKARLPRRRPPRRAIRWSATGSAPTKRPSGRASGRWPP